MIFNFERGIFFWKFVSFFVAIKGCSGDGNVRGKCNNHRSIINDHSSIFYHMYLVCICMYMHI